MWQKHCRDRHQPTIGLQIGNLGLSIIDALRTPAVQTFKVGAQPTKGFTSSRARGPGAKAQNRGQAGPTPGFSGQDPLVEALDMLRLGRDSPATCEVVQCVDINSGRVPKGLVERAKQWWRQERARAERAATRSPPGCADPPCYAHEVYDTEPADPSGQPLAYKRGWSTGPNTGAWAPPGAGNSVLQYHHSHWGVGEGKSFASVTDISHKKSVTTWTVGRNFLRVNWVENGRFFQSAVRLP